MKRKIWPWAVAAAVFAADRITKALAKGIPEGGHRLRGFALCGNRFLGSG